MDKYTVLKEVFGHTAFREGQEEIIDALCSERDVLAVMPTGGGKSVCYQIPALLSDGVTLVVSPLISLMKDQVMSLVQNGVRAAYINSSLTYAQYLKVQSNMRAGVYKIVYLAPERLRSEDFLAVCDELDIGLIAVDEAHCVSGWGQDFRPAYLGISSFVSSLRKRPTVGAFTATATERVRLDIKELLALQNPLEKTTGFDRPNLFFEVIPTEKKNKPETLLRLMRERYADKSGIIYCSTRAGCEEVSSLLRENGFDSLTYHAGMDDVSRHAAQDDFIYDRHKIMTATNAFGMGIDKSDVAFVIHYNMPKDVESYYQEAGRAGRDGADADCVLLYSESDVALNRFLIEKGERAEELSSEEEENLRRLELSRLDKMADYCKTRLCLRAYLLRYFGERVKSDDCGKCSNCIGEYVTRDITEDAKKVLSCIARTNNTYGGTTIAAILKGSMNENIEKNGLDSLSTYGIMRGQTTRYIRRVIDCLRLEGYLTYDGNSTYKIPALTPKARDVLFGRAEVYLREKPEDKDESRTVSRVGAVQESGGLLERLKAERLRLARENSVPAYVIFTDAALYDMCVKMPQDLTQFLMVSGVGRVKAEKYGEIFIEIIRQYGKQK